MTVTSLQDFRASRTPQLPCLPEDPYVGALEARIITVLADQMPQAVVLLDEALTIARCRAVYRRVDDEEADARAFVAMILRLLEDMSPAMVARLRHPAHQRNRSAQQHVIETALGIRRETS